MPRNFFMSRKTPITTKPISKDFKILWVIGSNWFVQVTWSKSRWTLGNLMTF